MDRYINTIDVSNITCTDIYNIFGNAPRVIELFLETDYYYPNNKKLFFDLVKRNNIYSLPSIRIKINRLIDTCITELVDSMQSYDKSFGKETYGLYYGGDCEYNEAGMFMIFTMLKKLSKDNKLVKLYGSLEKMHYIKLYDHDKRYNKWIAGLNDEISSYFAHIYLYKICMLQFNDPQKNINSYQNIKNLWINQFIKNDFVIFPCNLDKTPMIKKWNRLTQNDSQEMYQFNGMEKEYKSHAANYMKQNIGMLCGKQSQIIVIDIDLKDSGVEYWNDMLSQNDCKDLNTLKVRSGSGGYHYYFKWTTLMKGWFSKNRIFSTPGNKVGIDFRADNGYMIIPPSIHHDTQNLYRFENISEPCNIREHINEIPGWLFQIIDRHMTCLKAEKTIYLNCKIIGQRFQTKELCDTAVSKCKSIHAFARFPNELKTKELCKLMVGNDRWALRYVPDKLKTKELCELAVSKCKNGWALQYVPNELKTKEMCELAVGQNGIALQYVSDELKTKEMCELAVGQNGIAFHYVPNELKTKEMCESAVGQNGMAWHYFGSLMN